MFDLDPVGSANDITWYITNRTSPTTGDPNIDVAFTCPAFTGQFGSVPQHEYCLSIPKGGTLTLYLAATKENGATVQSLSNSGADPDQYLTFIIAYGKFCNENEDKSCTGTQYGQNLPFMAINAT
jgi:hypothetical protein